MQPYLLPNIELINLMSEIIPDDTIFNYSTNLDGFKREPNNLVGIFGMNYNTSKKLDLPISMSKKNNITFSIIKHITDKMGFTERYPLTEEYSCIDTNSNYNKSDILSKEENDEMIRNVDLGFSFREIVQKRLVTVELDMALENIYSYTMESYNARLIPVSGIYENIILPNLRDNIDQNSLNSLLLKLVADYLETLNITSYELSRNKLVLNNLRDNMPLYIIPNINYMVSTVMNNIFKESNIDFTRYKNISLHTDIQVSEDKFVVSVENFDNKPFALHNVDSLRLLDNIQNDNNVLGSHYLYNLELYNKIYDEELEVDLENIKESQGINTLTKQQKDELKVKKEEFLSINGHILSNIILDLEKLLVIWSPELKDILIYDISNKTYLDNLDSLNKLAVFFNSGYYNRDESLMVPILESDDDSLVIKTKITIQDQDSVSENAQSIETIDKQSKEEDDMYKINIVVPFRNTPLPDNIQKISGQDREEQLNIFTKYMTKKGGFIDRVSNKLYESGIPNKIDLTIVVQSQDGKRFNRGALLNIGYLEENDYDVYIFHDVDLLPNPQMVDVYATRYFQNDIVHFAAEWQRYKGPGYLGGVTLSGKNIFKQINGFPNDYGDGEVKMMK